MCFTQFWNKKILYVHESIFNNRGIINMANLDSIQVPKPLTTTVRVPFKKKTNNVPQAQPKRNFFQKVKDYLKFARDENSKRWAEEAQTFIKFSQNK